MNSVLVAALALPILGIVGVVATTGPASRHDVRARWVTGLTAAGAAAAWAVVAGASETPEVGGIVATTDVAVTAAGIGLLVAGARPTTTLGRAVSLAAVTAFAAGAGAGAATPGLPDRPLAAGVVALVVLSVVAGLADRTAERARGGAVVVLVAGVVSAVALSFEGDTAADAAPVMALVALALALIVAIRTPAASGLPALTGLVLPGLVLAADAVVASAPRTDLDRVGLAAAAVGALAAVATIRAGRDSQDRPTADRARVLPLAAVGAGVAVAFQTFPDARGAGLLLVAGGIVALASAHPWGLVATVPGLTAALAAFGTASEPEHAAAAGAAAAVLIIATLTGPSGAHAPATPADGGLVGVAFGFGVVPVWGWTGLTLSDHALGLAVAVAFALPVVIALSVVGTPRSPALPGVRAGSTGRIPSRRTAAAEPSHGSTILDFEGEVPVQDDVTQAGPEEEGQHHQGHVEDPEVAEDGRPPQLAVAVPPQPVLGRARRDRAPLRRGVRARSGRTP